MAIREAKIVSVESDYLRFTKVNWDTYSESDYKYGVEVKLGSETLLLNARVFKDLLSELDELLDKE